MKYSSCLIDNFKEHGNNENRVQMEAYMKNKFDYFGIKAPQRKELQKQSLNESLPASLDDVAILWDDSHRECQYAGQELLFRLKKKWDKQTIRFIEELVIHKSWWDTVDFLASNCVGHYFKLYPEEIQSITERWNASDNMWLVRTSILFQLKYKEETDKELLKDYCSAHQERKEFFIRKAIGWAFRQYGKFNPEWVKETVANASFQPLSVREALRLIK